MKLLTFLAALSLPLFGQEPTKATSEPSGKAQVRVDVLMVSVPEAKGLPLIPKLRDPKTVEATQAKLLEMIAAKEAELLDWPEVTVEDGSRSVSENIVEQRYPVEFEGPAIPKDLDAKGGAGNKSKILWGDGMIVPTTFGTRNTGSTIECECALFADLSAARLQIAAQFVHLVNMQEHPAGKNDRGELRTVTQPNFRTVKSVLTVTLREGERRLLFAGKPKEGGGVLIFFIAGYGLSRP